MPIYHIMFSNLASTPKHFALKGKGPSDAEDEGPGLWAAAPQTSGQVQTHK